MLDQDDIQKIKETVLTFLNKATVSPINIDVNSSESEGDDNFEKKDLVNLNIKLSEPQILIGERGQTLFETQRLLKIILNKKLQKNFYLNLDINDYKNKKVEYLKDLAKDLANEVSITKKEKVLIPMSSYERRIIHAELAQRPDIITESQGDGIDRHIVIKLK
jgi:spoIIIJ-associated protein